MFVIDEDGHHLESTLQGEIGKLYRGSCVGACFLYRRSVYERFGDYNTSFFCAEDYEYWLRLWVSGVCFFHLKEHLYFYRKNAHSLTATRAREIHEKTFQIKLLYWDKVGLNRFARCAALYKTYKKVRTPEMRAALRERHPLLAPVFMLLKGARRAT